MYAETVADDICKFIAEKVKSTLYISVADVLTSDLFEVITNNENYIVMPLFNFDTVSSSNPDDHVDNPKALIINKDTSTMLNFKSKNRLVDYAEAKTVENIDDVEYTLYFTYDPVTGEPVPSCMTSGGAVTDENGYWLDSEVYL